MNALVRGGVALLAVALLFACGTGGPGGSAPADPARAQITLLYDAFGNAPGMEKDWGFAAYVEYGGKRILFDTGNNAEIFEKNVKAKGIDLTRLDFVIMSHRHGDHTSGLNYLLSVNPGVKIYTPKENFGVFGAGLPGSFLKANDALPAEMRYYDGKVPDKLRFGTPWPKGNFEWVTESREIAPGVRLILLKGPWGVDLDVMEIALAIDTPDGIVLVVGCSHPTIEKIVETASEGGKKAVHLVVGGTHLLPAKPEDVKRIANTLHDTYKVAYVAPAHCTGELAFGALRERFGSRYLYAGLGTTLKLGRVVQSIAADGRPHTLQAMDEAERQDYRRLLASGLDEEGLMVAQAGAGGHRH
ncbi:MAG: MBL fold metallo-hydrolase [Rhodocyclaceae bacterium]|nr:MBL fold metallo-hydrolase [Rhodocyclaceae bacterium]